MLTNPGDAMLGLYIYSLYNRVGRCAAELLRVFCFQKAAARHLGFYIAAIFVKNSNSCLYLRRHPPKIALSSY